MFRRLLLDVYEQDLVDQSVTMEEIRMMPMEFKAAEAVAVVVAVAVAVAVVVALVVTLEISREMTR